MTEQRHPIPDLVLCGLAMLLAGIAWCLGRATPDDFLKVLGVVSIWLANLYRQSPAGRPVPPAASLLPVLILPVLLGACNPSNLEFRLLSVSTTPKIDARHDAVSLSSLDSRGPRAQGGVGTDYVQLSALSSSPIPSGAAGVWALSGSPSRLRFVASDGTSVEAGEARKVLSSVGTPSGVQPGWLWYDSTASGGAGAGYLRLQGGTTMQLGGAGGPIAASQITSGTVALVRGGLAADLSNVTAGYVAAAPAGSSGAVAMRALAAGHIPALPASQITSGALAQARGGLGADVSSSAQNCIVAGPAAGGAGALSCRTQVVADVPNLTANKITSGTFGGVVGLYSTTSDPSGSNGQIFYNSTTNKLRCYQNGAWTDCVSGGGAGGPYLSPVQLYGTLADSYGLSPGDFLGDYTTGNKFVGLSALTITGVRGLRYTQDCTYTAKLWVGGVAVATKSQAVTAGTPFEILFDTPYTVPLGTGFIVSVYDGGTRYSYTTSAPSWEAADHGFYPVAAGLYLIAGGYAGGDNMPSTGGSGHRVPVQPILQ